jgi:hypothetical protein
MRKNYTTSKLVRERLLKLYVAFDYLLVNIEGDVKIVDDASFWPRKFFLGFEKRCDKGSAYISM